MVREYRNEKVKNLKRLKSHLRLDLGSEEELIALGRNYLEHPIYPIICTPPLEILEGNRRHEGVLKVPPPLGGPEAIVPICITDEPMTEILKLEIQMQSAIHTRRLTWWEEYVGGSRWLELNPGATAEQLAMRYGRSAGMLSQILSASKVIGPVREAFKAGKMGPGVVYAISQVPEADQLDLLQQHLQGATRDQIVAESRKRRNGQNGQTGAKSTRMTCPIPGRKMVVQVSATDGFTLTQVIEAIQELMRELKKAADRSIDPKTFSRLMADLAKPTK